MTWAEYEVERQRAWKEWEASPNCPRGATVTEYLDVIRPLWLRYMRERSD